jgi:hypothetical protein
MRLSGSYFKKLDDLAKWLFRRHENLNNSTTNAKNQQEPKTQNENSGVVDMELSVQKLRSIKTEGENNKKAIRRDRTLVQSCTICLDKTANAVLMNCGHGAICFDCGLTLLSTTCECHLCRQPIVQVLRIDMKAQNDDLLKVVEAADLFNIGNLKKTFIAECSHNGNTN